MKTTPHFFIKPTALAALAALLAAAGCSSVPDANPKLDAARSDYTAAQGTPRTAELASAELKLAGDALKKAEDAWARNDKLVDVNHLAYLAQQRVAVAQETAKQKAAELAVVNAEAGRDKARLAARTGEAEAAQRSAVSAEGKAQAAQSQAEEATRQANASQQQAAGAQARSSQLEAQLKDMNAKQTDRGMVVTIGDVLFDTGKADLKSGGMRSVEKLVGFLKTYPQRKALVEGFTDSVGGESQNQALSGRRADAVRSALVDQGVGRDRVGTHGYGEAYPVAGNDSASGRQMNRRVEIVLSDDTGNITPR